MPFYRLFARASFGPRFHAVAAWTWLSFGIFGLVQYVLYLHKHPDPQAFMPVAASIPVLYFISVYANVASHWAAGSAEKPTTLAACPHCGKSAQEP